MGEWSGQCCRIAIGRRTEGRRAALPKERPIGTAADLDNQPGRWRHWRQGGGSAQTRRAHWRQARRPFRWTYRRCPAARPGRRRPPGYSRARKLAADGRHRGTHERIVGAGQIDRANCDRRRSDRLVWMGAIGFGPRRRTARHDAGRIEALATRQQHGTGKRDKGDGLHVGPPIAHQAMTPTGTIPQRIGCIMKTPVRTLLLAPLAALLIGAAPPAPPPARRPLRSRAAIAFVAISNSSPTICSKGATPVRAAMRSPPPMSPASSARSASVPAASAAAGTSRSRSARPRMAMPSRRSR